MPLDFKGLAVYESASGDIRFVGQNRLKGIEPAYVVCRTGGDVLKSLSKAKDPDPRELLRVFHKYKGVFHEAASTKFDRGDFHPRVTIRDIIL